MSIDSALEVKLESKAKSDLARADSELQRPLEQTQISRPNSFFKTHASAYVDQLQKATDFILVNQQANGAIAWHQDAKLDPWDHVESAMALSVAGEFKAARKAYDWLAQQQLSDGSWWAHYYAPEPQPPQHKETNFIAYFATGLWHYYLCSNDFSYLEQRFSTVVKAIEFVLKQQSCHGEIAWAVNAQGESQDDALVTACCSIARSLDCAVKIAEQVQQAQPHWLEALAALKHALIHRPERFDRHWQSKSRFAMDWYYPILAGICSASEAQARIEQRWHEFVVISLGCRCVNDEPWVTVAETSELIIALCAINQRSKAEQLFNNIQQWQDSDGGYWTGYVYRDNSLWPIEKTTWTAAAVILAADALMQMSPAHALFAQSLNT